MVTMSCVRARRDPSCVPRDAEGPGHAEFEVGGRGGRGGRGGHRPPVRMRRHGVERQRIGRPAVEVMDSFLADPDAAVDDSCVDGMTLETIVTP
jgi:hypothetical protein